MKSVYQLYKEAVQQSGICESLIKSLYAERGAAYVVDSIKNLNLRHALCFVHLLNLVVKKSLDATSGLENLRTRACKVFTFLKTSTMAKEKLQEMQEQMNWAMLQRHFEERQSVGTAIATAAT